MSACYWIACWGTLPFSSGVTRWKRPGAALMPVLNHWETTEPEGHFPNYEAGTWGLAGGGQPMLEKPWRKWRRL